MIKSFRHKGLRAFFETGSKKGIQAEHAKRLRLQLDALDSASSAYDMDIPGYQLHALLGPRSNRWSIWVSNSWRLTFEFMNSDVYALDYENYH